MKQIQELEERRRRVAILQDAEWKAKEEEEQLRLQLEYELEKETERLQRMKLLEKEEKKRCKQEQLERQRIILQHSKELKETKKKRQDNNSTAASSGNRSSFFNKILGGCKTVSVTIDGNGVMKKEKSTKTTTAAAEQPLPLYSSIENFQRRVMWQPISLPPKDVVRITTSHNKQ